MDSVDRLREVVIHQSANRPNQLMGGDRELMLGSLLTRVALAFSLASWWGAAVAAGGYIGAMAVLKRMGKADPLLRQVYMRHIRYRRYYSPKSGLSSRCLPPPMAWR